MCINILNVVKCYGEIKMKHINTAIKGEEYRNFSHATATFYAKGPLTKSATKEVNKLMQRLLSAEGSIVNLDMSGLSNLDFWGANQLTETICRILVRGQQFNICCENIEVRNLLELLRINELAPILSANSQTGISSSLAA